jgi:hypothetical protein
MSLNPIETVPQQKPAVQGLSSSLNGSPLGVEVMFRQIMEAVQRSVSKWRSDLA